MAGKMPTVGQGADFPAWADTAREQKFLNSIRDARASVGTARNAGGDAEKLDKASDRLAKARDQLEAGNFDRARELTEQANEFVAKAVAPAPLPAIIAAPPPPAPTPDVPTPLIAQPPAAPPPPPPPSPIVDAPDIATVKAELSAVRADFDKALKLADRAKVADNNLAKNADPARYRLNMAQEALNRGKPGEANVLISAARAEIAEIYNRVEAKAGRNGDGALSTRAARLGEQVLQDATVPVVEQGTTLAQVIESVAPARTTNAIRDQIANLRNDSNAARHKGMDTGGDVTKLDSKIDRLAGKAERMLQRGDVSGAESLLRQGGKLVDKAEKVARKGGDAPDLTLSQIKADYRAALASGDEDAGSRFLKGVFKKVDPEAARAIAATFTSSSTSIGEVKGEMARALNKSDDGSVKAQITRLYLEQSGYSYVTNSGQRFARTTQVDAKRRDVDTLFTRVVNVVGGKGASDGRETVIHAGDKGKVTGTLFDDSALVLGKPKGKLDIDLKQGDDSVMSVGVDLKGARIDLGRGRDTAVVTGNELTNVRMLGKEGKDSITVVATDAVGLKDGKPAVIQGQITGMKLDAGFDSDTVTVQGNVDRSTILLNDGSDRLTLNADAATADRTVSRTTISAGDGRWNGEDVIAIGGKVSDTNIDLSESWRGHGNDTVVIADTLKGNLAIVDDTHSTATWQGKHLKHDDTILLAGDGWSERGEATEKGNAFIRAGAGGKVEARISLGSGDGDGEIEKVMTTTADGGVGTVFRQEEPELFAKPFGVTAGEWGLTLAKAAISTAIPGAAIVFAVGDAVMAASKGDVFGAVLAAAGGFAGGLRVAAAGTALPGASTYIADATKAASVAGRLEGFADVLTKAAGAGGVVRSAMDGKFSLTDILSAGSYGLSLAGGAGGSRPGLFRIGDGKAGFSLSDARQALDLGNVAAGVIENKGDLSGVAQFIGSEIGGAIRGSIENAELRKSAAAVANGEVEAPFVPQADVQGGQGLGVTLGVLPGLTLPLGTTVTVPADFSDEELGSARLTPLGEPRTSAPTIGTLPGLRLPTDAQVTVPADFTDEEIASARLTAFGEPRTSAFTIGTLPGLRLPTDGQVTVPAGFTDEELASARLTAFGEPRTSAFTIGTLPGLRLPTDGQVTVPADFTDEEIASARLTNLSGSASSATTGQSAASRPSQRSSTAPASDTPRYGQIVSDIGVNIPGTMIPIDPTNGVSSAQMQAGGVELADIPHVPGWVPGADQINRGIDTVNERVVRPATQFVQDNIVEPINENVVQPVQRAVDRHIVQPGARFIDGATEGTFFDTQGDTVGRRWGGNGGRTVEEQRVVDNRQQRDADLARSAPLTVGDYQFLQSPTGTLYHNGVPIYTGPRLQGNPLSYDSIRLKLGLPTIAQERFNNASRLTVDVAPTRGGSDSPSAPAAPIAGASQIRIRYLDASGQQTTQERAVRTQVMRDANSSITFEGALSNDRIRTEAGKAGSPINSLLQGVPYRAPTASTPATASTPQPTVLDNLFGGAALAQTPAAGGRAPAPAASLGDLSGAVDLLGQLQGRSPAPGLNSTVFTFGRPPGSAGGLNAALPSRDDNLFGDIDLGFSRPRSGAFGIPADPFAERAYQDALNRRSQLEAEAAALDRGTMGSQNLLSLDFSDSPEIRSILNNFERGLNDIEIEGLEVQTGRYQPPTVQEQIRNVQDAQLRSEQNNRVIFDDRSDFDQVALATLQGINDTGTLVNADIRLGSGATDLGQASGQGARIVTDTILNGGPAVTRAQLEASRRASLIIEGVRTGEITEAQGTQMLQDLTVTYRTDLGNLRRTEIDANNQWGRGGAAFGDSAQALIPLGLTLTGVGAPLAVGAGAAIQEGSDIASQSIARDQSLFEQALTGQTRQNTQFSLDRTYSAGSAIFDAANGQNVTLADIGRASLNTGVNIVTPVISVGSLGAGQAVGAGVTASVATRAPALATAIGAGAGIMTNSGVQSAGQTTVEAAYRLAEDGDFDQEDQRAVQGMATNGAVTTLLSAPFGLAGGVIAGRTPASQYLTGLISETGTDLTTQAFQNQREGRGFQVSGGDVIVSILGNAADGLADAGVLNTSLEAGQQRARPTPPPGSAILMPTVDPTTELLSLFSGQSAAGGLTAGTIRLDGSRFGGSSNSQTAPVQPAPGSAIRLDGGRPAAPPVTLALDSLPLTAGTIRLNGGSTDFTPIQFGETQGSGSDSFLGQIRTIQPVTALDLGGFESTRPTGRATALAPDVDLLQHLSDLGIDTEIYGLTPPVRPEIFMGQQRTTLPVTELDLNPIRNVDRRDDVTDRGTISSALRNFRLELADRNDVLEGRRDEYVATRDPGERFPGISGLTSAIRTDSAYINAERADQQENRPNTLQRLDAATEGGRETIGNALERYSNVVPWAANQILFNPFVNNILRPTATFIANDVVGGIDNAINDNLIAPVGERLFGEGSPAFNFLHNDPLGNDLRLALRELTLSTSNPARAPLDKNSLLDQSSRWVYERLRAPELQQAFVEPAQAAVDLGMAVAENIGLRAQPVIAPVQNAVTTAINAAAIGTRLATTQALPAALAVSGFTGDLRLASRPEVLQMLRLNNYSVSAPYTDPDRLGGLMITTGDNFPVNGMLGFMWTGPTIKGYNPEALMEGDFGRFVEAHNMIPTMFTRSGPNGATQAAYNAGSRAQLSNFVIAGAIGEPYLQGSFNLAAQPGAAGTSLRGEGGDLRAGDGLGAGGLGYLYVAPLRLSGEYNLDIAPMNLPLPSRLVLNSNRFAFEPGKPGDPTRPGNYLLGGQDDLLNGRVTLGLDPLSLKGTDYPRFQPNDGIYLLPQATGSGSNAPVRIGLPTRWPYGSKYDQTYSVNPLQLEAAEALRRDFPVLSDFTLPNGQTLFKTPEQIRDEKAETALGVLGGTWSEIAVADNAESLDKLVNSLVSAESETVQQAVRTLMQRPGSQAELQIIEQQAPWLLDVQLRDGTSLIGRPATSSPAPTAAPRPDASSPGTGLDRSGSLDQSSAGDDDALAFLTPPAGGSPTQTGAGQHPFL